MPASVPSAAAVSAGRFRVPAAMLSAACAAEASAVSRVAISWRSSMEAVIARRSPVIVSMSRSTEATCGEEMMLRPSRTSPRPSSSRASTSPGMARVSASPAMRLTLLSRSVAAASSSSMGRSLIRVSTDSALLVRPAMSDSTVGMSGLAATPISSPLAGATSGSLTSSMARSLPSSEVDTSLARIPPFTRSSMKSIAVRSSSYWSRPIFAGCSAITAKSSTCRLGLSGRMKPVISATVPTVTPW